MEIFPFLRFSTRDVWRNGDGIVLLALAFY